MEDKRIHRHFGIPFIHKIPCAGRSMHANTHGDRGMKQHTGTYNNQTKMQIAEREGGIEEKKLNTHTLH